MVASLIRNNLIHIYLQPIISIKDRKIIAFEALTRAFDESGELISPLTLFDAAKTENMTDTLDCYVRDLALVAFAPYVAKDGSLILFLNFESSLIENKNYFDFIKRVESCPFTSANIVVEVKEDKIKSTDALVGFLATYREAGFLIGLDDFGTGYSSFDRLSIIRPDVVKIDRSLIYNNEQNFINSEIISAIANMCNNIGALVLAEGVETKEEILNIIKKDVDIFQGFYFSKAVPVLDDEMNRMIRAKMDEIGLTYVNAIKEQIKHKTSVHKTVKSATQKFLAQIQSDKAQFFDEARRVLASNSIIEALYLLDHAGQQVGETIIDRAQNRLYSPTDDGHDHSLKEYYFVALESKRDSYLSDRYISKASGNMCRTFSMKAQFGESECIVCVDIKEI